MPRLPRTLPRRKTVGRSAERRPNLGREWEHRQAFASAISDLLTASIGERPTRESDFDQLLNKLQNFKRTRGFPGEIPDNRTILNWCNGETIPQWRLFELLWQYFFDGKASSEAAGVEIRQLWEAAEREKQTSSDDKRRNSGGFPGDETELESQPGVSDWLPENGDPLNSGVAVLRVHAPPINSNAPLVFSLKIELAFGEALTWLEKDYYVKLSLSGALLTPELSGCQPVEGTRLGTASNLHQHVVCLADVWHINGPRPVSTHLEGEPLGTEAICKIARNGHETDRLSLVLRSSYRMLLVKPERGDLGRNATRNKVLQILLQKSQKEEDGFITWGEVQLKRRVQP
jgi:hypothetical protein